MFNATPQQLEEVREQFRERQRDEGFAVWPENWRAFELFNACGRQWTTHIIPPPPIEGGAAIVRYQGIDLRILDSVEARLPPHPSTIVPDARELFYQFNVLVDEACHYLNER